MLESPLLPVHGGYWNGAWQRHDGPTFPVVDPADGAVLAELPRMGAAQARAAVDSAARAPVPTLEERARMLSAIAGALREHTEELARIIVAENGKPLVQARGEVAYAAAFYETAIPQLERLRPHTLAERPRDHTWQVVARPAGIAGLITPWNFPIAMLAKKLSGAIGAGCPSVVKPSEETPLTCLAFFTLLDALELPPGLVNLVYGDAPAIGEVLCADPRVAVISFTGSTRVGRLLAAQCAPQLTRLSLELGGNAPFVVFADADLDRAVEQLLANKFRNSGQTCVCANRVLVEEPVADELVERLKGRLARLRVGPGGETDVDVGPMINAAGVAKVHHMVVDALSKGATLELGEVPDPGSAFVKPALLTGLTPAMACAQDEIFGPVVAVQTFSDEAEAIALADDTIYGLAAYVFTADLARAERVAAALHFGHVGLNTATGPTPEAPFGGMRQSGLGREGGAEGLFEFVELQTLPRWEG